MSPTELSPALREHLAVTYDLLRLLGEGGMGVVWLGRDRLLDREVAIKVLRRDGSSDQDTARRFLQEARLAARLQHPGIVPLLTFGEVGDERFYVMPFVRGETLADRIRRGPIPEPELRRIIAEVADALTYVHARGIVHRDVKPANILLDADSGCAVLTDFGIARLKDATTVTSTGLVVGTPRYLAPEQASAGLDVVDGRADIYALGLVAWEAATGTVPFGDVSANEMLARKLVGTLDDPRQLRPGLSATLSATILRAAATAPEDRFATAAALAGALRPGQVVDADPLEPFDSVLAYAAIGAVPAVALFTGILLNGEGALPLSLRVLIGGGIGLLLTALVATARLHALRDEVVPKAPWRELLLRACRPPGWWFAWWPKRFRHYYLVDHLPPQAARAIRHQLIGISWFTGVALAFQVPFFLMGFAAESVLVEAKFSSMLQALRSVSLGMPIAMIGALAFTMWPAARLVRRYRRAGLDDRQVSRLFTQLYSREALSNPLLAVLHEIERGDTVPKDLPALRDAIDVAQSRARADGWELSDVRSSVDRLLALDSLWREDERALAAEVSDGEAARAREQARRLRQLPALSAAQRQMLELLESQQRLIADSEAALSKLRERRARALAMATSLWKQLRALPAPTQGGDADSSIRAIAGELQQLLDE